MENRVGTILIIALADEQGVLIRVPRHLGNELQSRQVLQNRTTDRMICSSLWVIWQKLLL